MARQNDVKTSILCGYVKDIRHKKKITQTTTATATTTTTTTTTNTFNASKRIGHTRRLQNADSKMRGIRC